jgi:hypothetical protein
VLERRSQRQARERGGFIRILRTDARYRNYQFHQFLAGVSNMLIEAPLVFLVTRDLQASYTVSIAMTMVIPFGLSVLTLPLWARYLDRVHVAEFRSRQSVLWMFSQLALWLGAILGSLFWIAVSRVILGLARGGGSLAWQLGHNDFAPKDQLGAYMGVHVTLTGIRGATAPFVGMFLYVGWAAGPFWPAFEGIGSSLYLLAAAISMVSWYGFRKLRADMTLPPDR